VLLVYSVWLGVVFANGRDPRDFTIINQKMVDSCRDSSIIRIDPSYHYPPPNVGYDGAFYYMIALDPLHAACYLDNPNYRYTRILYPMTAKVLALNQPDWIPTTLILTNLIAIAGGTLALAAWLRRKNASSWLALLYGFYPGLFVSLWRDLTEPLSYGLVALAVYLFDFGDRSGSTGLQRARLAGLCFAAAILARETALVFAIVYVLALVSQRHWRESLQLGAIAFLPFLVYKLLIGLWLSSGAVPEEAHYPFGGLLHYWPFPNEQIDLTLVVVLPGLVCTAVALLALARRRWTTEVVSLFANLLVLVILLPSAAYVEYYATGRATTGVILAAILSVPLLDSVTSKNRGWLWVSSLFWFMPWYFLVPFAAVWADPRW
jgi:hypothetical protein